MFTPKSPVCFSGMAQHHDERDRPTPIVEPPATAHTQAVQNRSRSSSRSVLVYRERGAELQPAPLGSGRAVAVGGQRADGRATPTSSAEAVHQHYRRTIGRPGVRNVDPDAFRPSRVVFDTATGRPDKLCQNRIPLIRVYRAGRTHYWVADDGCGCRPRDRQAQPDVCAPYLRAISALAVEDCRDWQSGDATRQCGVVNSRSRSDHPAGRAIQLPGAATGLLHRRGGPASGRAITGRGNRTVDGRAHSRVWWIRGRRTVFASQRSAVTASAPDEPRTVGSLPMAARYQWGSSGYILTSSAARTWPSESRTPIRNRCHRQLLAARLPPSIRGYSAARRCRRAAVRSHTPPPARCWWRTSSRNNRVSLAVRALSFDVTSS